MCGIVGAVAQRNVTELLLDGLKRLEYRGYDSAGIAVINADQQLQRERTLGKVQELIERMKTSPLNGQIGISHVRWATHGRPHESNAHPFISRQNVCLVHNGIIENHDTLRTQLSASGFEFTSETDTEVIVHLISSELEKGLDFLQAVRSVTQLLEGAYALGVINTDDPDTLIAVRKGCPLVIGVGYGENFIASDHLALLPLVKQFIYLEEGDIALIRVDAIQIFDKHGAEVIREIITTDLSSDVADKGQYRHYMLKEIYEQADVLASTLEGRISETKVLEESFGVEAPVVFDKVKAVQIVACGTSYHAGLVARYWFESIAGIPCQVEVASEFRYRRKVVAPNTLFVTISQSGETADTLAALRQAKELGYLSTLAICNVPGSALVRESALVLMTRAGVEIGVASTKAFTTQLTSLLMLTILLGRRHGLTSEHEAQCVKALMHLPEQCQAILSLDEIIKSISRSIADKRHALFIARGVLYPIALEGALKLKEISYIHAEAYPAGELKHGPLALVDEEMPVIALAPENDLFEKVRSNISEVVVREGKLFIFTDKPKSFETSGAFEVIEMPVVDELIAPIVYTIPLQLLAYHVAVRKGTDVDQPRNLAKSVTVE